MAQKTVFAGFRPNARNRHVVAVVAFDGVVLGDLAIPCEIFGRGEDLPMPTWPYQLRVCSARPRVSTRHITLAPPFRLASLRTAGTIIVPGLDDLDRPLSGELLVALRRAAGRGARLASICTGAFVLAAAGLLHGRRATTHWRAAAELARRYPQIAVDPNVLYIDEGLRLTSAGAAAGLDLCLHLVRRDLGATAAAAVARLAVMPLERPGGQAQFITHEPPIDSGASLAPLLRWLETHIADDLDLPTIARRAAMSTRSLARHFRDQVGTTPGRWLTRARVRRAQQLLETTNLSIERVAAEVGFGSAAVLRERFSDIVESRPGDYRRAFRTPVARDG